jgi:hypothetical protein
MNLTQYIRENRARLTDDIMIRCPNITSINDEERRLWILNDEGMYARARSEGVRI